MKELCPDCTISGKCLFKELVNLATTELNLKKITDHEVLRLAAFEVHQKIAAERIKARERGCPNLNNVDPDYQGKELL